MTPFQAGEMISLLMHIKCLLEEIEKNTRPKKPASRKPVKKKATPKKTTAKKE